jgi:signal transduction histidine kinase
VGDQIGTAADESRAFGSGRYLWVISLSIIFIILAGCGLTIWNLRQQTIEHHRVAVRNLGFVLAEQTTRYVQVVDRVLEEVQSRVADLNLRTPEDFASAFDGDATRNLLRERLKNLPQANAFFLLRSDGHTIVTTRQPQPVQRDFSDRDYYRHFVDHDEEGPFVSAPVYSRVTGTLTVYLARRIIGPDHAFLGVAVGAIDLQYMTDFYRAIGLPPGEIVTLLRSDGLLLARFPDDRKVQRMPASSPWYALAAGAGGTYRSPGFLDGIAAIVSVHPLHSWPLVIDTAFMEPVALGPWRHQAVYIGLGGLAASICFAVLFAVIGQQFRRKAQDNAQLAATADALRVSESQIRDFADRAESASHAKSEFLTSMSDELRTPLNAVIGFSELIRDQPFGKISASYVEYATEINKAAHHLLALINDVLDFSRLEADRYSLLEETVELGVVVRSCIGMLKPRATEGGVRIDNRLNGMRLALRGDARAIKQIVLNLLSNAVKFTLSGGVVSLHIEDAGAAIALVVTDNGIGIDSVALASLGEPFHQADASIASRFGGSGLGRSFH